MKSLKNCLDDVSSKSMQNPKKLKLEMEEFRDLTAYLPTVMSKPLSTADELNTPVFGK